MLPRLQTLPRLLTLALTSVFLVQSGTSDKKVRPEVKTDRLFISIVCIACLYVCHNAMKYIMFVRVRISLKNCLIS